MDSEYVDELLESLKKLYKSAEYSDIVVKCGDDEHNVHQAVVYPRAPKLKELVDQSDTSQIDLSQDDPQAVRLLLHYLYHLDYPHVPSQTEASPSASPVEEPVEGLPVINGSNSYVSGHTAQPATKQQKLNGAPATYTNDTITSPPVEDSSVNGGGAKLSVIPDYSIEKEAFIHNGHKDSPIDEGDASISKLSKKKKKKARSMTTSSSGAMAAIPAVSNGETVSSSGPTNGTTAPVTVNADVSSAAQPAQLTNGHPHHQQQQHDGPIATKDTTIMASDTTHLAQPSPSSPQTPLSPNLTIHARVYALSTKYAIQGLRTLSSRKFAHELLAHWSHDDFLLATREAYTSTPREDRALRDAVLDAIKTHQEELLARRAVLDVIRGLELSFDLLMVLHSSGGSVGSSASSVVNGGVGGGSGGGVAGGMMAGFHQNNGTSRLSALATSA
ncbi:hypothetical protein Micbo1qcDRAFT_193188 [Microdochium bolleyi]|uniref:BTB domain-containing protein n=1 Tax=Microdochium bolleyi TaxID=196109 RepID=A0A136J9I8_9PEZI|nr:hypothetical protein Micbo1qcDRAFT_193188 [Microdochium bolleyi]